MNFFFIAFNLCTRDSDFQNEMHGMITVSSLKLRCPFVYDYSIIFHSINFHLELESFSFMSATRSISFVLIEIHPDTDHMLICERTQRRWVISHPATGSLALFCATKGIWYETIASYQRRLFLICAKVQWKLMRNLSYCQRRCSCLTLMTLLAPWITQLQSKTTRFAANW